jgi:hypothetical protein
MLDFLRPLKNDKFDFLTFLDGDKENSIQIQGQDYANPGEKIGGSALGDAYHIILFRNDEAEDKYVDFDHFDAILPDPLEYISGLIPSGWLGIIAKKTTTSQKIVDKIVDKMQKA